MENQDFSFDQSSSEAEPLTLPHFDDEATLQSARPVVPLHEVRQASRIRQRMLLAGALCVAAVVGAVTASLFFRESEPAPETEISTTVENEPAESADFVTPSGEATGANVNPGGAVSSGEPTATSRAGNVQPETESKVRATQNRTSRNERQTTTVLEQPRVVSDDEVSANEGDSRRERRREARRLRRERRMDDRRNSDGLVHIREIFEGSPRP